MIYLKKADIELKPNSLNLFSLFFVSSSKRKFNRSIFSTRQMYVYYTYKTNFILFIFENMQSNPLINILIRTSNRKNAFLRCLKSIIDQDYSPIRIIIGYDRKEALEYIPKGLEAYPVSADRDLPFWYDVYLPQLMGYVEDGYILCVDDDDYLIDNTVLSRLPLEGPGLLVQLQRGNIIVPKSKVFNVGGVGFPCLILHHSLKNIATITGNGQSDSFWIKSILSKVEIPFIPIVVVYSPSKGHGKCNS